MMMIMVMMMTMMLMRMSDDDNDNFFDRSNCRRMSVIRTIVTPIYTYTASSTSVEKGG